MHQCRIVYWIYGAQGRGQQVELSTLGISRVSFRGVDAPAHVSLRSNCGPWKLESINILPLWHWIVGTKHSALILLVSGNYCIFSYFNVISWKMSEIIKKKLLVLKKLLFPGLVSIRSWRLPITSETPVAASVGLDRQLPSVRRTLTPDSTPSLR